MAADTYATWLGQELGALVDELELEERQKRFMRSRWLDQIVWLERKAKQSQQRYYALRLIAIVGGLVVPALVSLNVRGGHVASAIAWTTFGLSLLVAAAVSVEGFFHHGDRWRHYRRSAEILKSHGWQFFELAGPYRHYRSHQKAFPAFTGAVETLIAEDVNVYVSKVMGGEQRQSDDDVEPARKD